MPLARDGAQAIDVFSAVHPDLLLLDVMLPKQLCSQRQVPG